MPDNLYTPNSIRTVGGRYINILTLDPATIHIEDIAHGLSNTPRFGGHLPRFLSVAQHSIDVCLRVPEKYRLQALMHDASDYLIGDMPSPIKAILPDFQALEDRIMEVIATKYQFPWPKHHIVHQADTDAMEWEWANLMLGDGRTAPRMTKDAARIAFLELFKQYGPAQ